MCSKFFFTCVHMCSLMLVPIATNIHTRVNIYSCVLCPYIYMQTCSHMLSCTNIHAYVCSHKAPQDARPPAFICNFTCGTYEEQCVQERGSGAPSISCSLVYCVPHAQGHV